MYSLFASKLDQGGWQMYPLCMVFEGSWKMQCGPFQSGAIGSSEYIDRYIFCL